jgi:hypothetical protein
MPSPFADGEEPVVSPELALVDPVLAAWSRQRLPAYPPYPPVRLEPARPAPVEIEPTVEPAAAPVAQVIPFPAREPDAEPESQRVARSFAPAARMMIAAVVLVAAGLYAHDRLTQHDAAQRDGAQHAAFNVLPPATAPSAPTAPAKTSPAAPAARTHPAAAKPAKTSPTAKPRASAKPRAATKPAAKKAAVLATPPPQAFGWPKVRNATAYRVAIFRGQRLVYAATTARSGVTFARTWTFHGRSEHFAPGAYRWWVRPVLAHGRIGAPIVSSTFTVVAR